MIRTGIFVYQQGAVSIGAPDDPGAQLRRFGDTSPLTAAGTHTLSVGIWLIVSYGEITVQGEHLEVVTLRQDKSPLPVPDVHQLALEPGATADQIVQFFTVSKGADAPDERVG
jgi:hypothetical protein